MRIYYVGRWGAHLQREKGYGTWAFVLASSEEEAWDLLEASAKEEDAKHPYFSTYNQDAVKGFRLIKSLQVIEPGTVNR